MSIRNIAKDLYKIQKEVEKLEEELANCPQDKKPQLENQLSIARKERDKIRKMLEGAKQSPPYRKPL